MMNEHYVAIFKQKLARKEATNWNWNARKEQVLAFKCAKEIEKRDWHVAKQIWLDEITQKIDLMNNGTQNDVERLVMFCIWLSKRTYL
jgi:hypothetical protein